MEDIHDVRTGFKFTHASFVFFPFFVYCCRVAFYLSHNEIKGKRAASASLIVSEIGASFIWLPHLIDRQIKLLDFTGNMLLLAENAPQHCDIKQNRYKENHLLLEKSIGD